MVKVLCCCWALLCAASCSCIKVLVQIKNFTITHASAAAAWHFWFLAAFWWCFCWIIQPDVLMLVHVHGCTAAAAAAAMCCPYLISWKYHCFQVYDGLHQVHGAERSIRLHLAAAAAWCCCITVVMVLHCYAVIAFTTWYSFSKFSFLEHLQCFKHFDSLNLLDPIYMILYYILND